MKELAELLEEADIAVYRPAVIESENYLFSVILHNDQYYVHVESYDRSTDQLTDSGYEDKIFTNAEDVVNYIQSIG
jgi:hypothetical protein